MKRGKASGSNLGCGKRACERGQSLSCNRASKQSLRDLVQVLPPQPKMKAVQWTAFSFLVAMMRTDGA